MDPNSASENSRYTVYDWAAWGARGNVAGAQKVLDYLQATHPRTAAPTTSCVPGESHPPSHRRKGERKNWLFAAAGEGCKGCVAYYLEEEEVDPGSESGYHHYTVLDWALWAKQQGATGADDLLAYLKTTWPAISPAPLPNGRRGKKAWGEGQAPLEDLDTKLTDGPGAGMMEGMGWAPGQTLGASGEGLEEPLRPDLTYEDCQGLGYIACGQFFTF